MVTSTDYVFPTGNSTSWARIGIGQVSSMVTFTVQYTKGTYSDLTVNGTLSNASMNEYWDVYQSTNSNVDITLYWENASAQGIDQCSPDLVLAHFDGTDWESFGNDGGFTGSCATTGAGTIKVTGITEFSPFTFGSLSNSLNALPIDLISFTAETNGTEVDLNWVTASEVNNDYFTIERSEDAIFFDPIATVGGAGNSSTELNYKMVDFAPLYGVSYYRLKQTDFDGKFEYSKVEAVTFTGEEIGKASILVSPNPVSRDKNMNILMSNYPANAEVTLYLRDNTGKAVYTNTVLIDDYGFGVESIQSSMNLSSGLYFLSAISGDVYVTERVVVMKR
jgi:hypothetical protein